MTIQQVLSGIPFRMLNQKRNFRTAVTGICCDSRRLQKGNLFVCIKGSYFDGRDFIQEAISKNCSGIVVDRQPSVLPASLPVIQVSDTRKAYALLNRNYYGRPDEYLLTVAITGTKGKTSTGYLIYQILRKSGNRCAYIGSLGFLSEESCSVLSNTTPEAGTLFPLMRYLVEKNYTHLVLEASSQSLKQHRTEGICFDYGIFLNLYPDHLRREEHLDMEEYFFWKASLLKASKHRFCCASLTNKIKSLSGRSSLMPIITFGKEAFSDYRLLTAPLCAGNLFEGRNIYILYPAGTRKRRQAFYTSLFGSFQAENILAAFCCTREMGVSIFHQKEVFQTCQIPGRGEILSVKPFSVILDYAHNGESLQRLLTSIRPFCPGRLICVFGCGGNRSPQRRFDMGRISGLYADHTIFTEDNPRYEDPDHIFQDLVRGILPTKGSYQIIESRKKAVLQAICQAQPGDCLVFAGKGSETYIERRGVREPYCEREYIHALLSSEC